MVSTLDSTGLTIETNSQIKADLIAALQAIYGPDINVASNTPDGQLINIFAQADTDLLELLLDTYNSIAVSTSYGERLDQLVELNGLSRLPGTFTKAYVQVTTNAAVTIPGLDQTTVTPFTISDDAGNQYELITSYVAAGATTVLLAFQAVNIGQVQTTPNTITNIITPTLGVASVNNPSVNISITGNIQNGLPQVVNVSSVAGIVPGLNVTAGAGIPPSTTILSVDSTSQFTMSNNGTGNYTGQTITITNPSDSIGVNEETDYQLKTRQAASFQLASTGPADALEALLRNTADIQDAIVVENTTGAPANGVPANGVWVIVNGGSPAEIGQIIYTKKAVGCAMTGAQSYIYTRPNGQTVTLYWDNAVAIPLYIAFGLIWLGPITMANADIQTALAAALTYKLGQNPTIADIIKALLIIAPTAIPTFNGVTQGVSTDGSTWESIVEPLTVQDYFTVLPTNIVIT
jgi:uncharacterized phage protein gp47/JayE